MVSSAFIFINLAKKMLKTNNKYPVFFSLEIINSFVCLFLTVNFDIYSYLQNKIKTKTSKYHLQQDK